MKTKSTDTEYNYGALRQAIKGWLGGGGYPRRTQAQLAKQAGISDMVLSNFVIGRSNKIASRDAVTKLARITGLGEGK